MDTDSKRDCLTLGIDTTSQQTFVSLVRGDAVLASQAATELGSAEVLTDLISQVANDAHVPVSTLQRVAICVGPGSFTGLRTGLATAFGLKAALGIPMVGISAFLARLYPALVDGEIVAGVFRASRAEHFWSSLRAQRNGDCWMVSEICAPEAVASEELEARIAQAHPGESVRIVAIEPLSERGSATAAQGAAFAAQYAFADAPHRQEGPRIIPLYVKPVNAKTLAERGVQNSR